jgi:cysteine desulfurase|tara:strand:- start:4341 stop:5405 length:1065 start_codon:yes stop_codon:yes gene_type:complete
LNDKVKFLQRIYLDHNASTPLRKEAKDAMLAVIDEFGNPSSIHLEGRKAKGIVERARAQIARAIGASNAKIIFTSSATEACALALKGKKLLGSEVEHEAVLSWISTTLETNLDGLVTVENPSQSALQLANSETGIIQDLPKNLAASDLTQAFGKIPLAFSWLGIGLGIISGHKIGGPKGIGALVISDNLDVEPLIIGGGQEQGIRAGTENVIAIAGFGAAAEASSKDLNSGLWDEVSRIRDKLEDFIETETDDTIIIGKTVNRLPNTSCFSVPGWKSEVQVMQMDLAGFSISAGSACSSGKVRKSKVLKAMGHSEEVNKSAVRVSLGLQTNIEDIEKFFYSWNSSRKFFQARII